MNERPVSGSRMRGVDVRVWVVAACLADGRNRPESVTHFMFGERPVRSEAADRVGQIGRSAMRPSPGRSDAHPYIPKAAVGKTRR